MQDNRPDRPDVITLPPLILAATIALGGVLNFFWPASLLPSALAAPLGILITLGAIALGISAIREMFAANTPLDVRKPSTEIVTSGVFRKSRNPIYLGMLLLCAGVAFLANFVMDFGFRPATCNFSAKRRDRTGRILSRKEIWRQIFALQSQGQALDLAPY